MKIKVLPEGREGIYLVTKEEAIEFVEGLDQDEIHCHLGHIGVLVGADWPKTDVTKLLNDPGRAAILVGNVMHFDHQLVVLSMNDRYAFDVGQITEDDLEVIGA